MPYSSLTLDLRNNSSTPLKEELPTNASAASTSPVAYSIVHAAGGRLRIRIPRIATDPIYAKKLRILARSIQGVSSVQLNLKISCLIVEFPLHLSLATLQEQVINMIQEVDRLEVKKESLLVEESEVGQLSEINWLDRLGLPILSLGLAVLMEELVFPVQVLIVGGVLIAAALPFYDRIIQRTTQQGHLDADVLDALWLGFYVLQGKFVAPALMLSLIETGDALRDATARAREQQVSDLMHSLNQSVRVERKGVEQEILLKELVSGDRVIVAAGEWIPISGKIIKGSALIDEHKLTGESQLVSRWEGHHVQAATQVVAGKIGILTTKVIPNTELELIVELLQSAPIYDTRVEDRASKVADAAVVPSLMASGALFALTRDPDRSLAPLHLDFSHGIRIATPSTVLAALTYAARQGIYIRSGRALEMLARIDAIVFDKTGTLTQGKMSLIDIRTTTSNISQTEVLSIAASAEQGNSHPIAQAILNYAIEQQIEFQPCQVQNYRIGLGMVARMGEHEIIVGSDRLFQQENIDLTPLQPHINDFPNERFARIYVAQDKVLLGAIIYTDTIRTDAVDVVASLKKQGYWIGMLTGDRQAIANETADLLKIPTSQIYADTLPDRKVELIAQLKHQGKQVAFVGDGINDAAALAHADVSISFASGIEIARETADIVLLEDDLQGIIRAIAIAKEAAELIEQNAAIILIPNVTVAIAGVLFRLNPLLSVIISNGAILMAELNSFRLLLNSETQPK
ncbi:heavy metal translocating P-type ATPase [Floridanema aerugineum]|uniref:Heavy metal translocating P-type ATPase n=1 Tax=Floridaenema aerugineum BLCC-F46 TaxID=3153654 RepID=A0ABV4X0Q8_9CYAN